MNRIGIGFRTKTAKAIAVAVTDDAPPHFAGRWLIDLYDPSQPETGQPHHEVMEMPWPEAQVAVKRWVDRINDVATEALRTLAAGWPRASIHVGVVGSPDRLLETLGNRHMRAHAAEGILYRRAIEVAAGNLRLPCRAFSDRDFEAPAVKTLSSTGQNVKSVLAAMGKEAGRPWRADERAAATAAWLAMAS